MFNYIFYHETNPKTPERPVEDARANTGNIFVVADGITIDPLENGTYPNPSPSGNVSKIICSECIECLSNLSEIKTGDIKKALQKANKKVDKYNRGLPNYEEELSKAYNVGSAVVAVGVIQDNRLIYGVLDDCYVSVFSDDLVDHPQLESYVQKTAKFFDANYDWSKTEDRRFFRRDLRNTTYTFGGETYGYGALDGADGYEKYLQLGEVELKAHDLVCVYTDGFIQPLKDLDFVKKLKFEISSDEIRNYIESYCVENGFVKEKTCFFIKIG